MSDEELAEFYLHSTMYLLNLMCYDNTDNLVKDLHSTMYLLNLTEEQVEMLCKIIYIPLCIY